MAAYVSYQCEVLDPTRYDEHKALSRERAALPRMHVVDGVD